jgi:hypothetical protein
MEKTQGGLGCSRTRVLNGLIATTGKEGGEILTAKNSVS